MYYKCSDQYFTFRHPTFTVKKCESYLISYPNIQYNYWNWQRVGSPLVTLQRFQRKTESHRNSVPDPPGSALPGGPSQITHGDPAAFVLVQTTRTATAWFKVPVMHQARDVQPWKLCPSTFVGQLGGLLQQAAGPGDDGQRDSAPELL